MNIKLGNIVEEILREGGKLFGSRAQRVTTDEMNKLYNEIQASVGGNFSKFKLSRALPSKMDHGDVDIVVSANGANIEKILKEKLGNRVVDYSKNGNIYSVLYHSEIVNKDVHVDFINAPDDEYDAQYDYLSYNDFSGVLGVITRRINFNYSTQGLFKIYKDKKGQYHYILLTKSLRDGLKMLGYERVLSDFDKIQNPDDVVSFISSSDLFDSRYLSSGGLNVSDRKRLRAGRKIANEIKDKLVGLNKHRTQPDEDYYIKTLFPEKYKALQDKIEQIESVVTPKSIYNGKWVMDQFPQLKPGPIIGKITLHLFQMFGKDLESIPEDTVKRAVAEYIKTIQG